MDILHVIYIYIYIYIKNVYWGGFSNHEFWKNFNLEKGAHQGDPVLAYLFILALKVLFIFIKSDDNIKSTEIFKHVFSCTAYPDDFTFF